MLAEIKHILPKTIISRERLLPISGNVLVRQGQRVDPLDVVAEAALNRKHLLLNIAHGLGISQTQADELIHYKVGDEIIEGDVIAGPIGLMRRLVRAPATGKVVLVGDGQILLELDSPMVPLRAGLSGEVVSIIPERGAVIETTGALVQGVWGNGHVDFGLMQLKISSADDRLELKNLDVSLRGTVVVGGFCDDPEVLKMAADIPLRGLVLASMSPSLIPLAKKVRCPILVLEGFGKLPMNEVSFDILKANDGQEVSINAEPRDRQHGTFPEIVIPLPVSGDETYPETDLDYRAGQVVRIVREPAAGQIATIQTVHPGMKPLANGLKAQAADVILSFDTVITVPLINLEIIA